jgi:hypothetical protein
MELASDIVEMFAARNVPNSSGVRAMTIVLGAMLKQIDDEAMRREALKMFVNSLIDMSKNVWGVDVKLKLVDRED